jgi:hypothetical protein
LNSIVNRSNIFLSSELETQGIFRHAGGLLDLSRTHWNPRAGDEVSYYFLE